MTCQFLRGATQLELVADVAVWNARSNTCFQQGRVRPLLERAGRVDDQRSPRDGSFEARGVVEVQLHKFYVIDALRAESFRRGVEGRPPAPADGELDRQLLGLRKFFDPAHRRRADAAAAAYDEDSFWRESVALDQCEYYECHGHGPAGMHVLSARCCALAVL